MNVRKAVIPVAGFGTRFLPASRSVPKTMFPVFDTPSVHLAVEEAVEAGITEVFFIVSSGQETVEAYFDSVPDLERALEQVGNFDVLRRTRSISKMVNTHVILQEERLGLGDAVLLSRGFVGNEPFAVFLPDDVIWSDMSTIGTMIDMFDDLGSAVIAVREVADEMVSHLGIISSELIGEGLHKVTDMVEKPNLVDAPSNLAIIGRYVLPPDIFNMLEMTSAGANGEIQLTDAISSLLARLGVYAYEFKGTHFDVGTPVGLLKASVYSALHRAGDVGDLRRWLGQQV